MFPCANWAISIPENFMKIITKNFKTLRRAAQYQDRLYERFDFVRLVTFPRFGEAGFYTWEVK